jgi:replicative DNA helicase
MIADACSIACDEIYSSAQGRWIKNGTKEPTMFISTEQEKDEIQTMIIAFISDVDEEHIITGNYLAGEWERVTRAAQILSKCPLYIQQLPDFSLKDIENTIKRGIRDWEVRYVFFDYIHTTTDLISEYQGAAKSKMALREDQVLGNLSSKLKELTRKYNISIDSWTQVTGDFKKDSNRDQTIVRGSKAIIDKCDVAAIVSRPSEKELGKIGKIIKSAAQVGLGKEPPNICMSVYKNRGGKYNNVKIWLYIDYSTMRVSDMFVTDYEYNILPIEQNYVHVTEDNKIHVFTDKEAVKNFGNEIRREMEEIVDDEELLEDGEKRLKYHMSSTMTSEPLNKATKIPKVEVDEDDFVYDY